MGVGVAVSDTGVVVCEADTEDVEVSDAVAEGVEVVLLELVCEPLGVGVPEEVCEAVELIVPELVYDGVSAGDGGTGGFSALVRSELFPRT